jgi:hypothetical protein
MPRREPISRSFAVRLRWRTVYFSKRPCVLPLNERSVCLRLNVSGVTVADLHHWYRKVFRFSAPLQLNHVCSIRAPALYVPAGRDSKLVPAAQQTEGSFTSCPQPGFRETSHRVSKACPASAAASDQGQSSRHFSRLRQATWLSRTTFHWWKPTRP